jgi:hypothetical protein
MPSNIPDRWINICPYPAKKDISKPPPPVKHMPHVKNMAKNRKPISYSGLKQPTSK